jgi:hypothetical protein
MSAPQTCGVWVPFRLIDLPYYNSLPEEVAVACRPLLFCVRGNLRPLFCNGFREPNS